MRQGLRQLTDIVERIETDGTVVEDATVSRGDGGDLAVDLSLRLSLERSEDGGTVAVAAGDDGTRPRGKREGEDGEPSATGDSRPIPDVGSAAVRVGETLAGEFSDVASIGSGGPEPDSGAGSSSSDEAFGCPVDGCEERFETEHGMKIHATKAHKAADGSAPSPHRDPERLSEVYERHDTFAEMTEALDADVTPQTVRRSMMSLGIHDPDADGGDTADDADAADDAGTGGDVTDEDRTEPTTAADGGDVEGASRADDGDEHPHDGGTGDPAADVDSLLPDGVDGEAFVAAVEDASTIYEVQRAMGMDREEVQTLLAELDLLDLVHGRVATERDRDVGRAEIQRRISQQVEAG